MKAPLSWLKQYVDIDISAEKLQEKLFSCGFEVEDMIYVGKNIDKIVTCKILSIEKHPNADKLSVTKVDAGKYGILQIVTNGKNISVGDIVPVAVDGATLNSGDRIFKGELRGVPSDGMFCSGEELGINDDWYLGASENAILIFKEDFPLGEELKKLLEIEDVIFDINVTANRPDCQSILGLAREVAAVLNKPIKLPDISYKVNKDVSTTKTVKVENKAFDLCPRYISHLVKNIKIEQSPLWLKRRLFSMGIRSINNIVDITNYVLLEIGQPMHAFDLNDLQKSQIIVRRAENNEKIVTLDEKEFALNNLHLVICDGNKPVALAGIMGGLNSEIKDTTKDVLFESAKFARDNIRKSSKSLGQRTDASSRYEKGVDAFSTEFGMNRALHLIDELNCGEIACDRYDLYEKKFTEKVIETTFDRVNGVLGIDVPKKEITDILTRLNFIVKTDNEKLTVTVPLYREDMEDYPDIAEEIIREYGYEHITPTLLDNCKITNGGRNEKQKSIDVLKNLLTGFGFNEIISYSFVSEKEFDLFGIDGKENAIRIMNPLGEDMAVMRKSLLPSIVKTVVYNLNRKNFEGRIFEIAKTYFSDKIPLENLPKENQNLSIAMFGECEDFFTVKGVIEGILQAFCFDKNVKYIPSTRKSMHPTRSAEIMINDVCVGYFGQINPIIANELDADKEIFAGEIFLDLLEEFKDEKIVFKTISKFPQIERDLAIMIDDSVNADIIFDTIKESAGEFLSDLSLFDIYKGNQIEEGKKSMAFRLNFVSTERTLNVEEIDQAIKNILNALRNKCGAELR